ncbi:hypothetical protein L7F22_020398 [Adiantum nelumboides]|nr:hypothetical protein [Adiantum nelumboides]
MEALMIRAASVKCHASSLVLSLPQAHLPHLATVKQTIRFSHRGGSANALATLPSWTSTYKQQCRASPPCYYSATSSTAISDQRLDLALSVGSVVIPHPAKVEKGGEDAFFVSSHNGGVLGVADGVSGWAEENVDPALFSRELVERAVTALDSEVVGICPRQLLAKAHEATSAIGAATVIIAILEKETGVLHVANLGDCGLRVVRRGKIVFATLTQQHYFDCPYQLSSEPGAQTSSDAMVYKVELLPGDIVVMGSDGLFDNLFDKDIESTANCFGGSDDDCPQRIASALASLASKHSKDKKYESPYSQEAILQASTILLKLS